VTAAILAAGGKAKTYVCDVSQEDEIIAVVKAVTADWGRIDILINNVAISDNKTLFDITKAEWDLVIAVCLTAPMLFSKYAAQAMIAGRRGGKIVNVSSTSGYYGRPRAIAYTAAKAGVINLTRSLAIQLAPHNIRVNCVVPNKIGSPVGKDAFNPDRKVVNLRNRPGEPIDLARAMLFLVSSDSDFIAGTELFVDGGCAAMMPGGD
jgi:NAD(P)-dependent dehydrogenase (short-subunit alcohol dehydrogenase family)